MLLCISGTLLITRSICSELIKSSVNHRKAWVEIWHYQWRDVGRKVLWECGTTSSFIFCHLVLSFHASGRGTPTVAESKGGICKWQEDRAIW